MTTDIIFKQTLVTAETFTNRPSYDRRLELLAPLMQEQVIRYKTSIHLLAEALNITSRQVSNQLKKKQGLKNEETFQRVYAILLEARSRNVSVLELMTKPGENPPSKTAEPTYLVEDKPQSLPQYPGPGQAYQVEQILVPSLDPLLGIGLVLLGGIVGSFLTQLFLQ